MRDELKQQVDQAVKQFLETLPAYQALNAAEQLIAFKDGKALAQFPKPHSNPLVKKTYVLTTPEVKELIFASVRETMESSPDKSSHVQKLYDDCLKRGIEIPGVSPKSTLVALVSQRKQEFERVGEGRYRLKLDSPA